MNTLKVILIYIALSYMIMLLIIAYSTYKVAKQSSKIDYGYVFTFAFALGFAPVVFPFFAFNLIKNELKERLSQ